MTTPTLPPHWRTWPTRSGQPARYARHCGSAWADVVADGNGWAWRVTVGVHVVAHGRRIIADNAFKAASSALADVGGADRRRAA